MRPSEKRKARQMHDLKALAETDVVTFCARIRRQTDCWIGAIRSAESAQERYLLLAQFAAPLEELKMCLEDAYHSASTKPPPETTAHDSASRTLDEAVKAVSEALNGIQAAADAGQLPIAELDCCLRRMKRAGARGRPIRELVAIERELGREGLEKAIVFWSPELEQVGLDSLALSVNGCPACPRVVLPRCA